MFPDTKQAAVVLGFLCAGTGLVWESAGQTTNPPAQPYCVATNAVFGSFSPDGKQLAYYVHRPYPRIEVMDLPSRTNRILVEDAQFPTWSPDGRWIAFQQTRTVVNYVRLDEVLVIKPSGGRARFVHPGTRPHWDVDGQRLFVMDQQGGQTVACRVDKPEDQAVPLWPWNQQSWARVAPDGQRVALLTNEHIAVFSREKQELQFLVPVGANRQQDFSWTPGHAGLLVALTPRDASDRKGGVWWVDLEARKLIRLAQGDWFYASLTTRDGPMTAAELTEGEFRLWVFPNSWWEARKKGTEPVFEPPPMKR